LGWKPGTLTRVYGAHRQESAATMIESSAVGRAVCAWMRTHPDGWEGTMEGLLEVLTGLVSDSIKQDAKRWPRSPRGLRGSLDRLAPDLRRLGIMLSFHREPGGERDRKVCITTVPTVPPSGTPENPSSVAGRS
jgi:hypothetical protein